MRSSYGAAVAVCSDEGMGRRGIGSVLRTLVKNQHNFRLNGEQRFTANPCVTSSALMMTDASGGINDVDRNDAWRATIHPHQQDRQRSSRKPCTGNPLAIWATKIQKYAGR